MIVFFTFLFIFQIVNGYTVEFDSTGKWDHFLPNSGGFLNFSVKVETDAYVLLVGNPAYSDPKYAVHIHNNAISHLVAIDGHYVSAINTTNYLDKDDFRGFWIRWTVDEISVGRTGYTIPFLNYTDINLFPIMYVGFSSSPPGSWMVESEYRWVSNRQTVSNPVMGGQQAVPLCVIRARIGNNLIPGSWGIGQLGYIVDSDNTRVQVEEFEVLTDLVGGSWLRTSGCEIGANIPPNAIEGGYTSNGEKLYIGRAIYNRTLVLGKVVPSLGKLFVDTWPVVSFDEYDVLVQN